MKTQGIFTQRQLTISSVVLSCAFGLQSLALEDSPTLGPNDFAFGRNLIVEKPGSLQSVLLDLDVYRQSVEPELADLRVFDALGKPVPYAIRRRLPQVKPRPESKSIPIFRFGARLDHSNPQSSGIDMNDYRIKADLSATGAIVSIQRSDDVTRTLDSPPAGWLLDTSELDRAITHLDFNLAEGGGEFVSRLRLESSDDLSRFTPIDVELALVRLAQSAHRIEQMSFDIPRTRARYLRISPIGAPLPTDILGLGVRARMASSTIDRRHFRKTRP